MINNGILQGEGIFGVQGFSNRGSNQEQNTHTRFGQYCKVRVKVLQKLKVMNLQIMSYEGTDTLTGILATKRIPKGQHH